MSLENGSPGAVGVDPGDGREARVVVLHDAGSQGRSAPAGEFSGPEAADLAGISYRQLDYWARQQWVIPSGDSEAGAQRRVYTSADIVRLAALGHLGRSRVDVATYGRATGQLRVPDSLGFVIVWAVHDEHVRLTSAKNLRRVTSEPGRYVVFDPSPLLRTIQRRRAESCDARPKRRTFTRDYKLAILAEYEGLVEPGAKGALLRREALHTSHLVAWRRDRDGHTTRSRRSPAATPAAAAERGGFPTRRPVATHA